ncbi:hypothetical protein AVEN_135444-1 [Araneus ventricosus]|uniref:Uncharacterized protein n=1 Tax=Araneus ventricosus TaxID=182803 RepID=A0A4Y2BCT5_ARAVE|nr:hypothetical protein AVEN_135444-1 [Araneus ventricosus]
MFSKQERRSWIKIECARGRTTRQCHQGLQEACGESAWPYRTVTSDRRHTIRELSRETGLAHTTVFHILKEHLGMRKIASRWVPHDLTEMQKWLRYDAARNHFERYECEGETSLRWMRNGPNMGYIHN